MFKSSKCITFVSEHFFILILGWVGPPHIDWCAACRVRRNRVAAERRLAGLFGGVINRPPSVKNVRSCLDTPRTEHEPPPRKFLQYTERELSAAWIGDVGRDFAWVWVSDRAKQEVVNYSAVAAKRTGTRKFRRVFVRV